MKRIEVIGKVFNKLTVLEEIVAKDDLRGRLKLVCKCECGNIKTIRKTEVMSGRTKSCGCNRTGRLDKCKNWTGHGEIAGSTWSRIIHHAIKTRDIEFNISIEFAWSLFLCQERKCAISGLDIDFSKSIKDKEGRYSGTASLDRIDSSKGYVVGNVQWLHKDVNMMKRHYSQDYFINICKTITKYNEYGK